MRSLSCWNRKETNQLHEESLVWNSVTCTEPCMCVLKHLAISSWISPSAVWQRLRAPSPSWASLEAENLFGLQSSSVNWQRERRAAWHRRPDHAWRSHCSYCQEENNWTKFSCKFPEATEFKVGSVHSCRWQVELPVCPDSLWIIWRRKRRRWKTVQKNKEGDRN